MGTYLHGLPSHLQLSESWDFQPENERKTGRKKNKTEEQETKPQKENNQKREASRNK
jgi:hypothetical protein